MQLQRGAPRARGSVVWLMGAAVLACESKGQGMEGASSALTLEELAWTPGAHAAQSFIPGSCCAARDEPGCEVQRVQDCVCDALPGCCEQAWTNRCVALVSALHCASCGGQGARGPTCGTPACDQSWCGSEYHDRCPEAWANNSACDCGCQFQDPMCDP